MNADAFRHFYEYHFSENRKLWDTLIVPLPHEKFIQKVDYSVGSVRNQIVHRISCDDYWFSGLRGLEFPDMPDPAAFVDHASVRAYGDKVEQNMRDYLTTLRDEMLFDHPFPGGGDEVLIRWQVLLHVVNHGTDHRAQLLRLLHDLGAKTPPQDYIFYIYDHP